MERMNIFHENLKRGNAEGVIKLVNESLETGISPKILIEEILAAMTMITDKYKVAMVHVPELLLATRAMKAGFKILKPLMKNRGEDYLGTVMIATVKGDLHDVGKNLVGIMMEANGLKVVDLGVDVSIEKIINKIKEEKPEILCLSALLTTTMPNIKEAIKAIRKAGLRDQIKIMIGGAPVTEEFCKKSGADMYTPDAVVAAEEAVNLLNTIEIAG